MLLWQLGIITGKKQQYDPFPKINCRQQDRLEMETCFHFAILGNGNGNTFPLQAWTWMPWWQVMQEGDGPVMNQPSPLIQCRLSCRPRLFGIASAALVSSRKGGGVTTSWSSISHPPPQFQRRLSCRLRLFGIASAAVAHAGRGGRLPLT
jgi:hypothetical protein